MKKRISPPNQANMNYATQVARQEKQKKIGRMVATRAYYETNPQAMQSLTLLYNMLEASNMASAIFTNELAQEHGNIFHGELKMMHAKASKSVNEMLKTLYSTIKGIGHITSPVTAQGKFIAQIISLAILTPPSEFESTLKTFEYVVQEKIKKGGK